MTTPKPKLSPADLLALDRIISTRMSLACPSDPVRPMPVDLDLEARIISARWDGAALPAWFSHEHFYSSANAAIFEAVDTIRRANLEPRPDLVARAIEAAGVYVPAVEDYAAQLRDSPAVVHLEQACRRLRTLSRRREALVSVRRALLDLEQAERASDITAVADTLRAAARELELSEDT